MVGFGQACARDPIASSGALSFGWGGAHLCGLEQCHAQGVNLRQRRAVPSQCAIMMRGGSRGDKLKVIEELAHTKRRQLGLEPFERAEPLSHRVPRAAACHRGDQLAQRAPVAAVRHVAASCSGCGGSPRSAGKVTIASLSSKGGKGGGVTPLKNAASSAHQRAPSAAAQ